MEKQRCVKMDIIMKNMLIHALKDVCREQGEKKYPAGETIDFMQRLNGFSGEKLYLTDREYGQAVHALNRLRDTFIRAGRYTDGIDTILLRIMKAKYKKPKSQNR